MTNIQCRIIQITTLCLKKTGHLKYFQISPTKLDQYQYFLVQRIANKYAPTGAYNFAICCKTENQLRFSTGNQSRGWRTIIM